jgi:hypothetical protein
MALQSTIRRRLSIPNWPQKRRALRHLALSLPPLGLAAALYSQGLAERRAARHGEPTVLAARAAIRTFFHHRDAVSVLEHAVSGLGFALIGLFAVQTYYWIDAFPSAEEAPVPLWFRALGTLAVGGLFAALAWTVTYPGIRPYAALVALCAVSAILNCDGLSRRLARMRPGWFIGLVGGLVWANFDLAWKVYQWPTTQDPASAVLAHLVGSLGALIAFSALFGAVLRRFDSLRPPHSATHG